MEQSQVKEKQSFLKSPSTEARYLRLGFQNSQGKLFRELTGQPRNIWQISQDFLCSNEHITNIRVILTSVLPNFEFRRRERFYKTEYCHCFPNYCPLLWILLWYLILSCKSWPLLLWSLSEWSVLLGNFQRFAQKKFLSREKALTVFQNNRPSKTIVSAN